MLKWVFGSKRKEAPKHKAPPYEEARAIAATGTSDKREAIAKCEDLPPELLYYFASDQDVGVRKAVAANPGTPLQADVILSNDKETSVRAVLAGKIANILPDIRADQSEKLATLAFQVLETLANDKATEVRQIVADSVRSLDNVPKPIAALLARDVEDSVALPIIEFSPLLDEQDLLDLVVAGIGSKRLAAVSKREDLTPELIDAIVDTDDDSAVETLIGNEHAAIPDRTIDHIVEGSKNREQWQSALAGRSQLPLDMLIKLSKFATSSVLGRLRKRSDLGADVHEKLEKAVSERVSESIADQDGPAPTGNDEQDGVDPNSPLAKAKALHERGELTEATLLKAIKKGDENFVCAILAVLAGQPEGTVRRILKMDSAKSVLTLCWACGLTMTAAVAVQEKVVRLTSSKIMRPAAGGGYPLEEDDLEWQAGLLFQ